MPRCHLLVPTALLCLLVILTSFGGALGGSAEAANKVGAKAPEVVVSDGINGVTAKTKIADYKGSVTLVVLWLPICPHCKKFMPRVAALHKKYAAKGLKILTITHGKKKWTKKYLADRKWTFGVGFDWTGVTSKRYGMKSMPGVYLLGEDNKLRSYTGTIEQAVKAELTPKKKPKTTSK